jgi:hypothetical protein
MGLFHVISRQFSSMSSIFRPTSQPTSQQPRFFTPVPKEQKQHTACVGVGAWVLRINLSECVHPPHRTLAHRGRMSRALLPHSHFTLPMNFQISPRANFIITLAQRRCFQTARRPSPIVLSFILALIVIVTLLPALLHYIGVRKPDSLQSSSSPSLSHSQSSSGLDPNVTAVKEALGWIRKQQFDVAPPLNLYALHRPTDAGFAANFQRLAAVTVRALRSTARPRVVVQDLSRWSYGCDRGKRWDCFFTPLSPYSYDAAMEALTATAARLLPADQESVMALRGGMEPLITEDDMMGTTSELLATDIPDPWAQKVTPWWWWSVVQLYLFDLNAKEKLRTEKLLQQSRCEGDYDVRGLSGGGVGRRSCVSVGLHVRLGDRLLHDNVLHGVGAYAEAVKGIDRKLAAEDGGTRVCCVIAASDDDEAMRILPSAVITALGRHVPVHVLEPQVRRPPSATAQMAHFLSSRDVAIRQAGTQDILAVIAALSETNVLVALCMSQVGRTVAALQYAKGRARLQPVAMDRDFCLSYPHPFPILEGWVDPASLPI